MAEYSELQRNQSFLKDLVQFMGRRKKWYLIPVAVVIVLFALLVVLGGTAAAPFIYTVF
jgi:hypothetical protein